MLLGLHYVCFIQVRACNVWPSSEQLSKGILLFPVVLNSGSSTKFTNEALICITCVRVPRRRYCRCGIVTKATILPAYLYAGRSSPSNNVEQLGLTWIYPLVGCPMLRAYDMRRFTRSINCSGWCNWNEVQSSVTCIRWE